MVECIFTHGGITFDFLSRTYRPKYFDEGKARRLACVVLGVRDEEWRRQRAEKKTRCAHGCAASGQAIEPEPQLAPPRSLMNSRRLMHLALHCHTIMLHNENSKGAKRLIYNK